MIQLLRLLFVAALLPICAAQAAEVDNASLSNDADGTDWPAFGRTFSEQRFSPLDQINKQSVSRLKLAWSMEIDDVWNVSTAPVEVDGVLYYAAGFSVVHAVDVRTGKLLWKYDPHCDSKKMRMAWGIRGLTYWKGKLYTGVPGRPLVRARREDPARWCGRRRPPSPATTATSPARRACSTAK
jgi:quinohemoprotein ethanol dehydrogenase